MDLARRIAAWSRLSEPGAKSFACQVLLGALVVLLFWLIDAVTDFLFFGGGTFYHALLEPEPHDLADFSLVLFLVCSLLLYSRHAHQVQAKLEEALQEALQAAEGERAKLTGIVESMGDALSIQSPDLVVLYQNRAHQQMMGNQVGRHCYEAYRQQSEACPGCHLLEAFRDGQVHRAELAPPWTRDGRYVEIISSVVPGSDGKPALGIELVRDITARKLAQQESAALNATLTRQAEELQQANRELEAFCLAISHDLRAPLTRIYSSAQELFQSYRASLDENGRFFVTLVNDGCLQMEEMIDALMVLCRVTEMELVSKPVDLVPLAREIVAQLRLADPARQTELVAPPRVVVQGDPPLLRIVMENLVSNAWKYTAGTPGAVIELGVLQSDEGDDVIFVRDNGAGFDNSRSDELFKPFRRLHSSREFAGTGLGLATVRRIVRRHNGRVWGEGEPGRGATFYFTVNG